MTQPRRRALIGVLACVVALLPSGCAGRGDRAQAPPDVRAGFSGLYRVTVRDPVEGQRRFRLLLFAELPDRLHGEVLSPVGSVMLVFDGGGGRMAVTFVRDRVSFAGPAREEALERVLGVRLSLDALVRALLTGEEAADGAPEMTREADGSPALPSRLVLADGPRSVTLDLKRLQPLRVAASGLGRGEPPEGTEVRDLSELSLYEPSEGGSAP